MQNEMSPQEVLDCFKSFMDGMSSKCSRLPRNLVDSSLTLLRVLPASRVAVLEYLGGIHKEYFRDYMSKPHNSDKVKTPDNDKAPIKKVSEALSELVHSDESAFWSSMLSKWCIKTLGEMSQEFSNHRMLPVTTNLSTLQELIKFWTSCLASQSLVSILCACLSNLNEDEMYPCFDSLLANSMRLSPHFDWVVAYTGSRFPDAIMTRMLQCGLIDYHQNASSPTPTVAKPSHPMMPPSARLFQTQVQGPPPRVHPTTSSAEVDLENVSRIPSVVGILSHLALDFEAELKDKVASLFRSSIRDDAANEYLVGPLYIFHLASQSAVLFKAISKVFLEEVDTATLNKLVERAQRRNFRSYINYTSSVGLMARTLLRIDSHAFELINVFMTNAVQKKSDKSDHNGGATPVPAVSHFCYEVMNEMCSIMQKLVYSSSSNLNPEVRSLLTLRDHCDYFCRILVESKDCRRNWLFKILSCLSVGDTREIACRILSNIFIMDTNPQELSTFLEVQKCSEIHHVGIIDDCSDVFLSSLETCEDLNARGRIVEKMLNLCKWEVDPETSTKYKDASCRQPLHRALQTKSLRLLLLFHSSDRKTRVDLLRLLNVLGPPQFKDDVTTSLKVARGAVTIFYGILKEYEGNEKIPIAFECLKYLKVIPTSKAVQVAMIVWIMESALSPEHVRLFGGVSDHAGRLQASQDWLEPLFSKPNLMEQNRLLSSSSSSLQIFHQGEIPSRPKRMKASDPTPEIRLNSRLVLEALWCCGCLSFAPNESPPVRKESQCTPDVMKVMATTLVDFVMPDALMNSVHWPEEDFLRTSAERDLYVRRKFDDHPLLWHLLELILEFSGSTWSCLCILRSLLGNLIVQWESSRETSTKALPHLLSITHKVMEGLRMCQVVMEPLSLITELLPLISPYEVHLLMLHVWRYIKEYSPQTGVKKAFTCPPKIMDLIHNIMQNNIETCGHLFGLFFSA